MVSTWRFVIEIGTSVDPKIDGGGNQDSNLEPYDQVVKVGEGWIDLEPVLLSSCWVAK